MTNGSWRDIVAIGASAGGVNALKSLVAALPTPMSAVLFVTLHLPSRHELSLPAILSNAGPYPAHYALDGEAIEAGRIYIAPPDRHLLFQSHTVQLGRGPKENLQRPCINVMFRCAAAVFGERVIGVVLSGMLDDGAAGLWEIQQNGGVTVVQDPSEAAYSSMPESAIRGLGRVDHIVKAKDIGALFGRLLDRTEGGKCLMEERSQITEPSSQACPVCGGVMHRTTLGQMYEYHCHVGHRLGTKTMIAEKINSQERVLAAALAATEELVYLLEETKGKLDPAEVRDSEAEIERRRGQIAGLRKLLESSS